MFLQPPSIEIGEFSVVTTNGKGHDVDFWAKTTSDKIISSGKNCHPLIAEQAEAFKETIFATIKYFMKEAIKSDRTTLVAELERQGQKEMAEIIRRL
tara:strand:- start:6409 stop:6699 length:291 start_codon:yes stop_codon:yes gene_type:complete